jgi:lysyl-tRNA synthetase class I
MAEKYCSKADVISLKEYVDVRIKQIEKSTELTHQAIDKRLEGMNEFRDALKDQAAGFFTRKEHELYKEKIDAELKTLQKFQTEMQTKANQSSVNITLGISIIGIILGMVSFIMGFFK